MNNAIKLDKISVSAIDNNCYFLFCGDEALLIDAADNAQQLLDFAKANGARITAVVTTHQHWDHVRALQEVLDATGATHYTSAADAPFLPAGADVTLSHGDSIDFAGHPLVVSILRGHTPGGVAVAADIESQTHLFVGDSLFPGGVGKTNSSQDFEQLLSDVKNRIFDVYDDDAIVHPGHGKPTTVGAERPKLDEWAQRGW